MALSWKELLSEEVAHRAENSLLQVARAKFPFPTTIETFDFTFRSDFKGKCWVGSWDRN